jgi:hypothetical protein
MNSTQTYALQILIEACTIGMLLDCNLDVDVKEVMQVKIDRVVSLARKIVNTSASSHTPDSSTGKTWFGRGAV